MKARQIIWLVMFIALTSVGIIVSLHLMESARFNAWERMMKGPYQGAQASLPETNTDSSLDIGNGTTLMLFEDSAQVTILSLKDSSGKIRWSRSLIAEEQPKEGSGRTNRTILRSVSFQEVKKTSEGLKVVFLCDWDWGGREQGVFYLSPELEFQGFAVSW